MPSLTPDRLNQIDFDGTFIYSAEVEVTIALPVGFEAGMTAYPYYY